MRPIEFRGKNVKGEWVYGSLLRIGNAAYIYDGHSYPSEVNFEYDFIAADPATVGQFTGLFDKNGTRIYEGDICEIWGDYFQIKWDGECCAFVAYGFGKNVPARWLNTVKAYIGVIGNIHDNPELSEKLQRECCPGHD